MRILVCADSHGDVAALRQIVRDNPHLDYYLHCGDSELPPEEMPMEFVSVKGNCDFFKYPLKRDIKTPFGLIHMEHGDGYRARSREYMDSLHCFICLYGHTHIQESGYDGKTYYFNPGSLTRPYDSQNGSYLLINVDEKSGKLTYKFVPYIIG